MQIFYYGLDNNYGGMEHFAVNLIHNVKQIAPSIQFHIITPYKNASYKTELEPLGCKFHIISSRKKPIKFYKDILRILKESKDDNSLFQINCMSYRNYFLFKAAKKSGIKTIVVSHASNINGLLNIILHKLMRFIFKKLGLVVGVSTEALNFFSKRGIVINNSVEQNKFMFNKEYRAKLRSKLQINNDDFVIGEVGRINKQKNQLFLCKCFKELNFYNLKLLFVGKNQDKRVINYVKKNKLSNIIFAGEQKSTVPFYSVLDLFLFPSYSEGAGISLFEAISNGLPCIASNSVPKAETTKNKVKYLPLRKKLWVAAISSEIASKTGERNNYLNCDYYSSINQAKQYIKLYEQLTK